MMEGAGVTNYDTSKSTYAISAATTEFDEALIQRGIVTRQQALIAKGASEAEARRLVQQHQESSQKKQFPVSSIAEKSIRRDDDDDDDDGSDTHYNDDDDSFEDDEFFAQYRQQRLKEMKDGENQKAKTNRPYFGEVIPISRSEWQREVNEASTDKKKNEDDDSKVDDVLIIDAKGCWVVVCLTSSDALRTGCMEAAIQNVARIYPHVKFVVIPYTSAIPNWPMENLPSLFLYRHGKMQQDLVRLPTNLSTHDVEEILRPLGVLSSE